MKKIFIYSLFAVILFGASCTKGLDSLNINKVRPTEIDPVFQLNNAYINASYPVGSIIYEMAIVQQIVSPNGGVLGGANFNQDNRSLLQPLWAAYYRNVIRNTHDVLSRTKDLPERANLYNMTRIFQAYAFMVLTDNYGDIPYTEAGAGYTDQQFFPAYDPQEEIYNDIINELTEASAALDPAGKIETGEILYGGNIGQWKRFGYSLLLRAGMRLSKANAGKAETTVQAAVTGGVMSLNADNTAMRHDNNYTQPMGNTLNSTEGANFYLVKAFVDQLKNTGDPRLPAIAIRYMGALSGPDQVPAIGSTDPANQVGMPMGYDNGTIGPVATGLGLASFYDFTQVDRRRMAKTTAPVFFLTASQTQLLLAEARKRGWITTGTEQGYYDAGVTLHMQQLASYDPASTVPGGSITTYLTNNPYNTATGFEQINTQYWISSFLNGPEAFANFRRSGYPTLTPNPYPGKDIAGDFIRRLTYPNSEISVNNENVNEAITRQGPDNLDTRVWWDKP